MKSIEKLCWGLYLFAFLLGAVRVEAGSNNFALSGVVKDVASANGAVHSADLWTPATKCNADTYFTLYLETNEGRIGIACFGRLACRAWNARPGAQLSVEGYIVSQKVGPGDDQVETVLIARSIH